jgi:hypothetical protein
MPLRNAALPRDHIQLMSGVGRGKECSHFRQAGLSFGSRKTEHLSDMMLQNMCFIAALPGENRNLRNLRGRILRNLRGRILIINYWLPSIVSISSYETPYDGQPYRLHTLNSTINN